MMAWSPTGPTVTTVADTPLRFVPAATGNLGGVVRVFNGGAGLVTFTLGNSALAANTDAIPVGTGFRSDLYVAYGPGITHIISSVGPLSATPGIARP